jgi:two-component sensor histidine kinase
MALIHSQLYENSDLSAINMKGFVAKLLGQILQSYPVQDTKITSIVHIVDYPLPIAIAIPLGLIVNELLSNAFKHAFVNRKEGKIEVVRDKGTTVKIEFTIANYEL